MAVIPRAAASSRTSSAVVGPVVGALLSDGVGADASGDVGDRSVQAESASTATIVSGMMRDIDGILCQSVVRSEPVLMDC